MITTDTQASQTREDYDLCIVGAGYAGLNGLNAAAKYMKSGERVVFIDKNASWGGQWNGQYDFVRLHQPYRMFTAGDQKWKLDREPWHLATRREVLDHLASVPVESASHLEVKAYFGHSYTGHVVRQGRIELETTPLPGRHGAGRHGAESGPVRIRARRLLKAAGFDITPLPPFPLSSDRVRSVGLADPVLSAREFLDDDRPVYIIGSGKSAMDCAGHVIRNNRPRRRKVNIIAGRGMWFLSRDRLYPRGARRHVQGALASDLFLTVTRHFDGHNEREVMRGLHREGIVISVFPNAQNCRLGALSLGERDEIRSGTDDVLSGHLVDVEGLRMTIQSGSHRRTIDVDEGAWFINCTTHLKDKGWEPVLADSGLVCAPQFAMGFTGASAYFLTHLWFQNKLDRVSAELFRATFDVEPKLRLVCQVSVMFMANLALATAHLPFHVVSRFEGDFNKWYPLHRQLPVLARVMANRGKILEKAQRVLALRFSDSVPVRGPSDGSEMMDATPDRRLTAA
jgi:hypothetical protein